MRLRFVPMTADDLAEVMEIERLSFDSPWTPGLFLHELRIPFSKVLVARAEPPGPRVAGYACWWVVGDEIHIQNLAAHPDLRRSGVGRALLELVLEDAARHAAATVTLEVGRENLAARRLYEAYGFVEAGVRRNYYAPGRDAIIMTLYREARPVDSTG